MGALSELRKKYGLDPYASNRDKPAVMLDPKTGRQTAVPRSMPREENERAANDGGPSSASEPKDVRSSLYGKTKEMREKRKENALKKSEEDLIKSRENRRQTSAREKYANRDKELTDAKTAVDTAALDNDKAVLEEALYNLYAAQESSFDRAVAKAESKLEQAKRQNENNKSRAISAAGAKAEQLKQSQDLAQPKQELEAARAAQYYHNQNKTVAAIEEDIKNSPEYFAALNEVQQEGNTSGGNIHERGMVQGTYGQRKIDAVTDEQKAVQRVLEQRGDTEKLAGYNEYLSQTTNKQLAEEDYEKLQNSGKVAQLLGYLGGGLGGAASWGATGVENIRRALGGEYRPIDTNSEWYSGSRVQAQAEEELLKDIDSPAARWFAQAGLSLADMAVKLPFGPVGMMAAFGAETAGNVAYDSLQRGATPDQAFANGTIAGLAEGLVSAIPVDRLFKVARGGASALLSKQGVKQVLQQAGLEANEELVTQYSQTIADIATMGNKSNWALEYQDYIAQGYSDKEAKEMTNFDFFIKEPLLAAAAGGMMGGIMGAGATAKSGGLSKTGKRQVELANLKQLQQVLDELKERMTANGSNLLAAAPEHLMLASPYTEENIYSLPEGSLGQRLALPEGEQPLAIGRQGESMFYTGENGEISLDKPWERPQPQTDFTADRFGNAQNAAIRGFLPEKTGAENSWESLVNEKLSKAKGEELSRLLQEIEERIALLQIEKNQALAALPQQVPDSAFSEDARSAIIEERTKYIEQSYAEALERLEKMAAEAEIRQAVYGNEALANANKFSGQNVPEANNIVRMMSDEAQKAEYDREISVLYVQCQYELAQIQEMPDGPAKNRRIQKLKDWYEQEASKLKNKYHQPLVNITQNSYNIDNGGTNSGEQTANYDRLGMGENQPAGSYRGIKEDISSSVPPKPTENIPNGANTNSTTPDISLTQAGNKEPASSMPETKGIEKDLRASEGQGEEVLSQFANENIQKAAESDRVSREIASALAGKTHKISSREKVVDKARKTINKYGMEAIADYLNKKAIDNKAATDTEIAAGIMAIQEYSRLSRQNSQGSNDEYGAKALDLANVMDSLATTAGRALNMYKIIQKELPGGLLRYANRQLQKEDLPPLEQDEINTFNDLLEMSNRAGELNDLTEQIIKDKKSLLNKDKIRGKAALKAIEAKIAEMFPDMSKEYRGYAAKVLLYKDSSEIGDWMTLLTQKMVADKKPATAVDKYRAYQRINLLLNTMTNLRNIGGNAMQTILETTSDVVGTGIDKLISGKTGNRTVAMPSAKAAWEGAIKGGSDAILAYRTNTLGIQGENRYADNQVSPSDVFSNGNILGRIGNPLNKGTSFLLTFGDKIFSGSREAVVKQELSQLREQGKLDITDEEIAEIARRQALQVTYQDDTGLSDFIINTRRNISGEAKARRKNSSPNAIRALFAYTTLPFAKTPANVLYRTLEYSAPGLVKSCIDVAKIRKGGWDITPAQQRRLVSAVSRGIVGVGLEGLGAILFANNLLSGSAPDDEAEKKEREMLGITDNSVKVKVGDKYYWVDFSSLGPLPAAMNVGANIYKEITDEFGEDPSVAAAALDVIKTMLAAPINDVSGDSLWEGLVDAFNYIDEKDVAGLMQEVLGDAAVQMVPLSSFMRAVTTLTDPYVRETSSEGEIGWTGNRIISQIPFLSSTLPIKYDVHGEAKKRAIGDSFADKLYSAFFAVGNASEDKSKDEVVEELLRLYNDSEDSSVLLDKAPYSIKKGGETYPLVGENRSQYQHTMGSLGKGTVNELINSPEFNYATTEQQIDMVAKALGYGKDTAKTDFFDQTEVAYDKDSYKLKYRLDRAKSYGVDPGVTVAVYDRMGKVDGNGPKATILINTAGLTKDQRKKIAHDYFGEKSETFSNNLATAIDNNYAKEFVNAYTRKNSYDYDIEQVSDYLNATGLSYRQKVKIMEMLNWGRGGKQTPKQYTKYLN